MKFIMLYYFYLTGEDQKTRKANLHDKTEYVIRIRNIKQALNHGLGLKSVHGINKF